MQRNRSRDTKPELAESSLSAAATDCANTNRGTRQATDHRIQLRSRHPGSTHVCRAFGISATKKELRHADHGT